MGLSNWLASPDPHIYFSDKFLTLDFETTNISHGNACVAGNRLLLACWKRSDEDRHKEVVGGEYDMRELLEDLAWADFFVAQNAKFELKWLLRCGVDLTKILPYDTMIGEYVIAGNRKWELNLGAISERRGAGSKDVYVDKCMKGGVCPSELPQSFLVARCSKDIYQTEEVFKQQREELAKAGLLPAMHTRCMFSPVLADMEMAGMFVDEDRVEEEYTSLTRQLALLDREVDEFTGGINMRSYPQKKEFIYDTLKFKPLKVSGKVQYGTDQDTIAALKATTKKQKRFVDLIKEYAKVNALLTKTVQFMYGVCKERGGLFYAEFNQCRTKTHRLSSSGVPLKFDLYDRAKSVQFQNFPRQYKPLFKPRNKGWEIGEIDGAQLEFRVAAFLGQDQQAKEDIRNGADVHKYTAQTITAAGQPMERQEAKAHTFKPLYGGQSGTKAEQAYYKAFKEKYKGVAQVQQAWLDEVVRSKSLRLASGLILYWPSCRITSTGYVTDSTQICNAPVQSLATAEMMPIAITYMWHRMKLAKMESFLVNTVHDSAIAEINPNERELFTEIGVKAFTTDCYSYLKEVYDLDWNIQMGAGIKLGDHWGEGNAPVILEYDRLPEGCTYKVDGAEVTYTL